MTPLSQVDRATRAEEWPASADGPARLTPRDMRWWPLLAFWLVPVAVLGAHAGEWMGYVFPAAALLFAWWALRQPLLYVVFTFTLYLSTPLVRRLADYGSSYHDPSPVLAAPLLVSLLCVVRLPRLLRGCSREMLRGLVPAGLGTLAVLYGLGIGFMKSSPLDLPRPTLEWLGPMIFGAFCCLVAPETPSLLPVLERITVAAAVLLSLYGLVQFVSPWPWDVFWLQNFNHAHFQPSFGQPERFQIRLFSTLNSPQTLAALLTFSLPLLLTLRSRVLSLAAMPLALLCLALTQSRSQFFTAALAFAVLALLLRGRVLLRLGILAAMAALALSFGLLSGDMANKISDRFDSFHDLRSDTSAISRKLGMQKALEMIVAEPFGQGVGFPDGREFERSDLATRYGVDTHDLGLVEVLLSFGYLGGVLYIGGFALALYRVGRRWADGDAVGAGLTVAIFACVSTMATVNLFETLPGLWLWTVLNTLGTAKSAESSLGWSLQRTRRPRMEASPAGSAMPSARTAVCVLGVLALLARGAQAQRAVRAADFVQSVGINVHLHYTDTPYFSRYALVRQALLDLHVHHLRDGVVVNPVPEYAARYRQLAGEGFRADFITRPEQDALALTRFAAAVGPALEAWEAPNEWDQAHDADWVQTMRTYLPVVSAVARRGNVPAYGPSLVKQESYAKLGDVSALESMGNLHNYPGGRNPGTTGWGDDGYGSFAWQQRNLRRTSPGRDVVSTETGYNNDPGSENFVPADIAALYLPRLLLLQYAEGIRRTYLYELLSSGKEDYGLLTASGERKPGFRAVAALLGLLDGPDARAAAEELPLQVAGVDGRVHQMLLQKADRRFFLALWVEAPAYDVRAHTPIRVAPETAQLTLPWVPRSLTLHQWQADGRVRTMPTTAAATLNVPVTDALTIVEIEPQGHGGR